MNSSVLSMTWANLSCDLKALDAMNNSRRPKTTKSPGHELKPLDSMIISGLWKTWTTLGLTLKALDAMDSSRLWLTWMIVGAQGFRFYEELKAFDDMSHSRSWDQGFKALSCRWCEKLLVVSSRLIILWRTQGYGWHEWLYVVSSKL